MPSLTGRQIMLLLGCALAILAVAVGAYGLIHGPDTGSSGSVDERAAAVHVEADPDKRADTLHHRSLPHTTEPVTYARAVAVSVFEWDTSAGFLPTDYAAAVLADADPSGEETPGLLDDVAAYLPTVEQWLDLGVMEVVQSIEIDDAFVPDSWAAAVEQAGGRLRPGTTAVTITGTRRRSGVWNGEVSESSYPVSFTVFVVCQPSFERCHVLRLSQLDNPLR